MVEGNSRINFERPDGSSELPVQMHASLMRPDRRLPEDLAKLHGELLADIQAMLDAQRDYLHAAFANAIQRPQQVHSVWSRTQQSRTTMPKRNRLSDQLDRAAGVVLPTSPQAAVSRSQYGTTYMNSDEDHVDRAASTVLPATLQATRSISRRNGTRSTKSGEEEHLQLGGNRLSVTDKSTLRRRMFTTLNDTNARGTFKNLHLMNLEDLEEAIRSQEWGSNGSNDKHDSTALEGDASQERPSMTKPGSLRNSRSWMNGEDRKLEGAFDFSKKPAANQNLDEEVYDVSNFYWESGLFQSIARSEIFQNLTLAVICTNAIYIGVDADWNTAQTPMDMEAPYLICENIFCVFFLCELAIRFAAFRRKRDCLKDDWFKFDTFLVILMVFETWFTPLILILIGGGGSLPTAPLRMLRLLRLSRMTRLMRSLPELLTMVKGMKVASRAVGSSLLMIFMLIYVFAIIMHMLLKDEPSLEKHFKTVPRCMWTLLMDGALMDSIGQRLTSLLDLATFSTCLGVFVFMVFTLLSSMTVMNMLIGVLCEVVSAVGAQEKDEASIRLMKSTILLELKKFDDDGNGMISQEELQDVINDRHALGVLRSLQVDVGYLRELQPMLFPESNAEVSIESIMDLILMCRGDMQPTVKHVISGQAFTRWLISNALKTQHQLLEDQLEYLAVQLQDLRAQQAMNGGTLPELYERNLLEL